MDGSDQPAGARREALCRCLSQIYGFWCRQPTGIGDNGLWRIRKLSGIFYLPDVGSMTTSFSSASAGIFASN